MNETDKAGGDQIGNSLLMIALLVFTILAIVGAKGWKWKVINFLIIAASFCAGACLCYLIGFSGKQGAEAAVAISDGIGCASAICCMAGNKIRKKRSRVGVTNG